MPRAGGGVSAWVPCSLYLSFSQTPRWRRRAFCNFWQASQRVTIDTWVVSTEESYPSASTHAHVHGARPDSLSSHIVHDSWTIEFRQVVSSNLSCTSRARVSPSTISDTHPTCDNGYQLWPWQPVSFQPLNGFDEVPQHNVLTNAYLLSVSPPPTAPRSRSNPLPSPGT